MTKKQAASRNGHKLGIKEIGLALLLILVAWLAQECWGINVLDWIEPGPVVETELAGDIQVYFTAPTFPETAENRYGGMDERLAQAIDGAQQSVDIAAFDFGLTRVADAVIRADRRGVRVRIVTDSDYEDNENLVRARNAGIPVVTDDRSAFMHNKFIVIDEQQVWTGSWNLTYNCTYRNNNNVVIIDSKLMAENYTVEFEEMFIDRQFGITSPDNTPHPKIELDGVLIETHFEAEGDVRTRMMELIEEAEHSVYFMAFAFTDDDIAKAMIAAHRAGLDVRGVMAGRNVRGIGSVFEPMQQAGVGILPDGNPYTMHHKVMILDGEIVITGSYNFTASAANRNDENVLIIHSAEIARLYLAEFGRVYGQAEEKQRSQ